MWSSPRMTWVMPSQTSSSGDAKLYVGRPSERTSTRSSSFSFGNSTRPRTASSHAVTPSSGMRKRIAPSSSYAFPSSTSRRASSAQSRMRSSWKVTAPSQSRPSQRSDSWICSVASATSRLVSVFSMRSLNSPPLWRANSQLKSAVRTFPMCRKPVGEGAMRTRTDIPLSLWAPRGHRRYEDPRLPRDSREAPCTDSAESSSFRRMLFGAHCSGGIKKALENAAGMDADAVQLFVQSPRTWRFPDHDPAALERFRKRREELGMPALVHSLYLVNLAAPDDE